MLVFAVASQSAVLKVSVLVYLSALIKIVSATMLFAATHNSHSWLVILVTQSGVPKCPVLNVAVPLSELIQLVSAMLLLLSVMGKLSLIAFALDCWEQCRHYESQHTQSYHSGQHCRQKLSRLKQRECCLSTEPFEAVQTGGH